MHHKLTLVMAIAAIAVLTSPTQAQNGNQNNVQRNSQSSPEIRSRTQIVNDQQRARGNAAATQLPQVNYAPQRPFGELSKEHTEYLDQVLRHWQATSQRIKRSTCEFTRYDYDPEICNWQDPSNNRIAAFAVGSGRIRFAAPDKGMYETTKSWAFEAPPKTPGEQAKYKPLASEDYNEKWICDGKAVYQYDFAKKRLYEVSIPPEMQGQGIVNSPLPFFLFGVQRDTLLERYWIRVITPQNTTDQIWLEAHPKTREDAQSYKKLEIIINREDFLPEALTIYAPNYDPVKNPVNRVLEFKKRKVNDQLSGLQKFLGIFVRPSTPVGWDRVNQNVRGAQTSQRPGAPVGK